MKVLVMVKTKEPEAGAKPPPEAFREMGKFNEELFKAGVILVSEGLAPSRKGKRVRIADGKKTVIDGPFAESKEVVAGLQIWEVKSMDEAMEWVRRMPLVSPGEGEVEVRPVMSVEDFEAMLPEDMHDRKFRLRDSLDQAAKK